MAIEKPKKNNWDDIVPPRRSIRDVEIPARKKSLTLKPLKKEASSPKKMEEIVPKLPQLPLEQEIKTKLETEKNTPKVLPSENSYKYIYDDEELKKKKRWPFYIAGAILLLTIIFGVSTYFKSVVITITPRNESIHLDQTFTASKDASGNNLAFQTVTINQDAQKTVPASQSQQVETKASGTIIIYNNYNSSPQKLIATTRFQTPEGLVFRLINAVSVPAKTIKSGKSVPGSIEAQVVADKAGQSYNIDLKDFSIPGLKGDPRYASIYGRSKTAMTGGFSGTRKVVSDAVMASTTAELKSQLEDSISKNIDSQIPANFVLFKESMIYSFSPVTEGKQNADSVVLEQKGSVTAILFDKGSLSRNIVQNLKPDITNENTYINNLKDLSFSLASSSNINNSSIKFNLAGNPRIVWTFDSSKLISDITGLPKNNAQTVISKYTAISEAWIEFHPFWSSSLPKNPLKIKIINTIDNSK